MTKETNLITVREAARECGRNMETVRRWIWAGKLPAEKLGNQLFIKKADLDSYCRETATVQYDTEHGLEVPKRLKRLRERIRARTGRDFTEDEIVGTIEKLREERLNELELSLPENTPMKYETETEKKEDFLERAIRFRNKLRARGYPEIDAAALVRKSREGRIRELRKSLR
ncbi:MAG: helix-turn-helix domain-containing protein [Chloroflexi bacterium]|nr:helix-turn-helix domain-containing protein [Chloroflexota bacterium]